MVIFIYKIKNISIKLKLVVIRLFLSGSIFAITSYFGSNGFFGDVNKFFPKVFRSSVAFENMDGQLKIMRIKDNTEIDPTLITRTYTTYILTIKIMIIFFIGFIYVDQI